MTKNENKKKGKNDFFKQVKRVMKMKINKKGFTLVELLATIVILALVVSMTMYIAINVIGSSKQKTYQVTINNVTQMSGNYIMENSNRLSFVKEGDIEYQCIKVKDLIDLGYLDESVVDSQVAEGRNVRLEDSIYVERDTTSKAITKNVYVVDENSKYVNYCGFAALLQGTIEFSTNPGANTWAREKDITIYYAIRNVFNMNSLGEFSYNYTFEDVESDNMSFNNLAANTTYRATSSGILGAKILHNGKVVAASSYTISKIDNDGPTISLTTDPEGKALAKATIQLSVIDNQSGVDFRSFSNDDIEVSIGGGNITSYSLKRTGKNDNNTVVNYTLTINDTIHYGEIAIKIRGNTVLDSIKNGNEETILIPKLVWKKEAVIPTTNFCNNNLTYDGTPKELVKQAGVGYTWSDNVVTDAGTHAVKAVLLDDYIWSDKTDSDKIVNCTVSKKDVPVTWGGTTTFTYDGTGKAPTATASSGVESETLNIVRTTEINAGSHTSTATCESVTGGQANCDNYNLTGNTKSYTVGRSPITVTAGNQTKVYDGTALQADATCSVTAGSLVAGQTVTCENTGSQINAGVGEKTITTATIYSGSEDVTNNYNSTKANGTLTVTRIEATCPTVTNFSGTYDGASHTLSVSGGDGGTIQYRKNTTDAWSDTNPAVTAAGTTTVYIKIKGDTNHNDKDCDNGTITINRKAATVTADDKSINYGGSAPTYTYTVSGAVGTDTVVSGSPTYTITNSSGSGVTVNSSLSVGTYTITPSDLTVNDNYTVTYNSGTLTVNASAATCPTLSSTTGYATGTSYSIGVSGGSGGTIQYRTSTSASWSNTNPSATAEGTTTVYVQIVGDSNHTSKDCGSATITISAPASYGGSCGGCSFYVSRTCNGKSYSIPCCGGTYSWTNSNCANPSKPKQHWCNNARCTFSCLGVNKTTTESKVVSSATCPSTGGGGTCFPANTLVLTTDGYKNIASIKAGDMILSYNEETGENEYHKVLEQYVFDPDETKETLYTLTFDDKTTLKVTSSHPIYVKSNNGIAWTEAKDINKGDYVLYADGTYHKVVKIRHKKLTETVYNLSVENTHNFYVGEQEILVHNTVYNAIFGRIDKKA